MEMKTKQRIIGVAILVIVFLVLIPAMFGVKKQSSIEQQTSAQQLQQVPGSSTTTEPVTGEVQPQQEQSATEQAVPTPEQQTELAAPSAGANVEQSAPTTGNAEQPVVATPASWRSISRSSTTIKCQGCWLPVEDACIAVGCFLSYFRLAQHAPAAVAACDRVGAAGERDLVDDVVKTYHASSTGNAGIPKWNPCRT